MKQYFLFVFTGPNEVHYIIRSESYSEAFDTCKVLIGDGIRFVEANDILLWERYYQKHTVKNWKFQIPARIYRRMERAEANDNFQPRVPPKEFTKPTPVTKHYTSLEKFLNYYKKEK